MTKSPGHRKWPEHQVREEALDQKLRVEAGGDVIAESDDVVMVDEDHHPTRYYFPRSDVDMDRLEPTAKTTECPFKGHARYFSVQAARDGSVDDAAWSYEDPFEEHDALRGRIAFHDDELAELHLSTVG